MNLIAQIRVQKNRLTSGTETIFVSKSKAFVFVFGNNNIMSKAIYLKAIEVLAKEKFNKKFIELTEAQKRVIKDLINYCDWNFQGIAVKRIFLNWLRTYQESIEFLSKVKINGKNLKIKEKVCNQ